MYQLEGEEYLEAVSYLSLAVKYAQRSTCLRGRCGSILILNDTLIGAGFNSPPGNDESQRRCMNDKSKLHARVTDKTCCVHAEQRALIDALRSNPEKVQGSTIYFMRVNQEDLPLSSGRPYCTICSKLALDLRVKEWVLWHEEKIAKYGAREYHALSLSYTEPCA
ncbi:hypothetical protein HYZ97_05190 [Candidatus Pacearchaeota archaeon]|nr:hypothetical protein [Candidatus Pacearchaeota archaeon]